MNCKILQKYTEKNDDQLNLVPWGYNYQGYVARMGEVRNA